MSGDVKVKNIYDGDGDAIDIVNGALKVTGNISGTVSVDGETKYKNFITSAIAATLSDGTAVTYDAIYVGEAGNLALKFGTMGTAVTFENVPSGRLIEGNIVRVMSTNTTAHKLVGLTYDS
jgi:hypothetical protein